MRIRSTNIPTIYLVLIGISLALFFFMEWINPEPVSWQATFSPKDKMPYGTYVLKNQLPDLFPGKSVEENSNNYFEILRNTNEKKIMVIINDDFVTDESALYSILDYVKEGNQVFISANYFMPLLADTLGFETNYSFLTGAQSINVRLKDNSTISKLKKAKNIDVYDFFKEAETDSLFTVLGTYGNNDINFIRFDLGEGSLFLHSTPIAFTNYYILNSNSTAYVEKVFANLDLNNVIWDDYVRRKSFLTSNDLMFITSTPALRTAFYVGSILIILFMIFYGKRRQRVVPIITPLKNSSLDFVDTISKLYLQQNKHKNIAIKQIRFFMNYIRLNYHVRPELSDKKFKKTLAIRSGTDEKEVTDLIDYFGQLKNKTSVTAEELLTLNKKIENFKKNE